MTISDDLILQAIHQISLVEGVFMDPDALAEDVFLLSVSFPEQREFLAAVIATKNALQYLSQGSVSSSVMRYDHAGWNSYHYQHRVAQGAKADCRIEWQMRKNKIYVRGFGHRFVPENFYMRMSDTRKDNANKG